MRIAVYGAGAAGALLAGFLTRSGEEVSLIARGERLKAINADGLLVESYLAPRLIGSPSFTVRPAMVTDSPAEIGNVDVAIVAVKAWQVTEAAEAMRPLIGANTAVLTLQNGVEAPSQVAAVLGQSHALVGVGTFVSMMAGLNHVRHIADVHPTFRFGEQGSRPSDRVAHLRQALEKAGFSVTTPPEIDVDTELWAKFAGVATNGGVGAITRARAGVWRSLSGSRQMRLEAVNEVLAIARARGVKIPDTLAQTAMDVLDAYPPEMTASMQRDIMEGRPSELDNQVGAVVRLGKESGVPTPVNGFIYYSLLPQELKARGLLSP